MDMEARRQEILERMARNREEYGDDEDLYGEPSETEERERERERERVEEERKGNRDRLLSSKLRDDATRQYDVAGRKTSGFSSLRKAKLSHVSGKNVPVVIPDYPGQYNELSPFSGMKFEHMSVPMPTEEKIMEDKELKRNKSAGGINANKLKSKRKKRRSKRRSKRSSKRRSKRRYKKS
jgi:hypothetical protein